jgi:F0F1-type ATP synthase alpha subunit
LEGKAVATIKDIAEKGSLEAETEKALKAAIDEFKKMFVIEE